MVNLELSKNSRRLHIGSFFVDLNESDYQELVKIFSRPLLPENKEVKSAEEILDEEISDSLKNILEEGLATPELRSFKMFILDAMEIYKNQFLLQPVQNDYDLKKLYDWLMDEKRGKSITHFTAGIARNIASEIEFRLFSQPALPTKEKEGFPINDAVNSMMGNNAPTNKQE